MYDSVKHFKSSYDSVNAEFEFKGKSIDELTSWQHEFRPRLRNAIGLDNLENDLARHPVSANKHDSEDMGHYVREKWTINVEPTVPLPFYLLRPKSISGNVPLVITPHGHNPPDMYAGITHDAKEYAHMQEGERDIAVQAVGEGYMAIAPTTRAFGTTRTEIDR
ncbi:uncharacterized protein METZ01_LOCUS300218, partial [marine metagenome]